MALLFLYCLSCKTKNLFGVRLSASKLNKNKERQSLLQHRSRSQTSCHLLLHYPSSQRRLGLPALSAYFLFKSKCSSFPQKSTCWQLDHQQCDRHLVKGVHMPVLLIVLGMPIASWPPCSLKALPKVRWCMLHAAALNAVQHVGTGKVACFFCKMRSLGVQCHGAAVCEAVHCLCVPLARSLDPTSMHVPVLLMMHYLVPILQRVRPLCWQG